MSARNAASPRIRCFVGATRPPMRWGVTYAALLFNLVFTLEAFLLTKNLLVLLVCVPIHGVCALLCARDARFFDLLLLWGRTRLRRPCLARCALWRASSYSPLPLDLPDARGRRRRAGVGARLGREPRPMLSAARRSPCDASAAAAEHIPYTAHVAPEVVKTRAGDYLQVLRLGGASFESADDEQLNTWHERLNVLWRNIASPGLRSGRILSAACAPRQHAPDLRRRLRRCAARQLPRAPRRRDADGQRALPHAVLSPGGRSRGRRARAAARARRAQPSPELALADALSACEKLRQTVCAALDRYEPEVLGAYRCGPHLVLLAA